MNESILILAERRDCRQAIDTAIRRTAQPVKVLESSSEIGERLAKEVCAELVHVCLHSEQDQVIIVRTGDDLVDFMTAPGSYPFKGKKAVLFVEAEATKIALGITNAVQGLAPGVYALWKASCLPIGEYLNQRRLALN